MVDGIHRYSLKTGLLLQQGKKVWRVVEAYSKHFEAELVLPRPERPMKCSFTHTDLPGFRMPNQATMGEYEKVWGLQSSG